MPPVEKALWYIERHLTQDISLSDIAASACVSQHHLVRAFGAATGYSVMRYVRGRRLSLAAQRLARGARDILEVAMEAGYNSHEAFTRAFVDHFGMTPAEVRSQEHAENLKLVQPIILDGAPLPVESPRFEVIDVLLIVGINHRYDGLEDSAGVPGQWARFGAEVSRITGRVGSSTYGVCFNVDDEGSMDYLCGVQVRAFAPQAPQFTRLRVPQRKYAVFFHREHIAAIRRTWDGIWNGWLPQSGHEVADAPLLERYDQRFEPQTGYGGVELLVPLH